MLEYLNDLPFINDENRDINESLISDKYRDDINEIYEFDGEKINKLNETIDVNEVLFEEHLPYYYDKSGKLRETAKLFYQLIIHEKIYRVEVRWKGNIYNASPQFQIHDDNEI